MRSQRHSRHIVQVLVDKHHRYALTPRQLFFACWKRENVLVSRNLFQYGFRFFVTMFMVRGLHACAPCTAPFPTALYVLCCILHCRSNQGNLLSSELQMQGRVPQQPCRL